MWNAAEKLLNFSPILHVSTGQIHKEAQYLHWKTQVKAGNALQNCSGQRIEHWNKTHSLTTWIPTNVTNISPQLYKSSPSSSVSPRVSITKALSSTTARVNARSCWFHPLFFTGDCVCVFKTATNDSLHNVTHCAKSVQDNKKVQTISTSFFFACSIAPFSLHCLHWSSVSGQRCHKLRKKKNNC